MTSDAVTVAYIHDVEIAHSWHHSLMELLAYDVAHEAHVIRGGWLSVRCGTDGIVSARNKVASIFIEEREAEWLFFVDTDMGFAPDTVDRLLAAADPKERPIVGGLCFAQREREADGMGGYDTSARVTIMDWVELPDGWKFAGRTHYPINSVVECGATGMACILIHRSVFEAIFKAYGATWYDRIRADDGSMMGEDISFCVRAHALDMPVFVHTGVRSSHLKPVWLSEGHFWQQQAAPPADEPVAVIIPVLTRPDNVRPLLASLKASTGLATAYFVADEADTVERAAILAAGAREIVFRGGEHRGTFAEKVNLAFRETTEPWLFLVGDDVSFRPGWYDHALHAARTHIAPVVGTRDLGNPAVERGEHSTHMLIGREYVEKVGASWDGPGIVAHEGYRHWFVDNEICVAAAQRGAFTFAMGSIVEHLHWRWGKSKRDDVYDLGESTASRDEALFRRRMAENQGAA